MKKRQLFIALTLSVLMFASACNNTQTQADQTDESETSVSSQTKEENSTVIELENEELRKEYPYLEGYLLKDMAQMRKNGQIKSTPFLNALESGEIDASAERLSYAKVKEIIEKHGCKGQPKTAEEASAWAASGVAADNTAACKAAIAEINEIQKYPDVIYDTRNLTMKERYTEGAGHKVYLTDDPDTVIIVHALYIGCRHKGESNPEALAYAYTEPEFPDTNSDMSLRYHYDSTYYDELRAAIAEKMAQ